MLYYLYEFNHAVMAPWRAVVNYNRYIWDNPLNPMAETEMGRKWSATLDLIERLTRRYGKPVFGIEEVDVNGKIISVTQESIWRKPFCELLHFKRELPRNTKDDVKQKLLIVAPMSGHYATLLRGTVETMLSYFDVYITDWVDARQVPLSKGSFDLDDYVDYLIDIIHEIGPNVHIMAVCQPSVPVMAAAALMAQCKDPMAPASMTLMGGPIDTRRNPTAVNEVAQSRSIDWFRNHAILKVPMPHHGAFRNVYPGFLQLTGFMTMNMDRHVDAHRELFKHMVDGDGDSVEKHEEFYDEYLSVMDLTEEFYLQTVERVFINHDLPEGTYTHRGEKIDPSEIRDTALFTIEGERDDISGVGQTQAAHDICSNIPTEKRDHYLQPGVGHYGVFNGRRFQSEIAPRIAAFANKVSRKS